MTALNINTHIRLVMVRLEMSAHFFKESLTILTTKTIEYNITLNNAKTIIDNNS